MHHIVNANVYVDGVNLLGKVSDCTLPNVSFSKADHKALGMIGTTQFFSGIEAMEATLNWSSIYPDVMKKFANPRKVLKLTLYSSLEILTSADGVSEEKKLKTEVHGTVKGFPLGTFKPGEVVGDISTAISVHYIKQDLDGASVIEIDVMNNIFKVADEDILAKYSGNIAAQG